MKKIYSLLLICCTLFFVACQQEEKLSEATGYLRLSVNQDRTTNNRAVPADYEPEQIAVQIMDATGAVVQETEDSEFWKNQSIELPVGTYTIKASSNGFDGLDKGFDIPYYVGSKEVTIASGATVNETVTCTLANVKVTVNMDAGLLDKVNSVVVVVRNTTSNYGQLTFTSTETRSGYFPVTGLRADITVTNTNGVQHTLSQALSNNGSAVKARDHYILNIKGQESGHNTITVTVDPTTNEYSYTFNVSTKPTENATLTAGAWDRLAYLKAANVTVGSGVSTEGIKFQYRTVASGEEGAWTDLAATADENDYTAFATGLTASTAYQYRLVNGEGTQIGSIETFTTDATDAQAQLQNAGFENWYQSGSAWYAASSSDFSAGTYNWDTSNPGSGSFGFNPTTRSTTVYHGGSSSAKLETEWAILKLAAASLYYGRFNSLVGTNGAKIDFGREFTSRPVAFKGWYQYAPVAIDRVGGSQPANTVSRGDMDLCSIYIILSKGTYQLDNTDASTLLSEAKVFSNSQFIAYGELPASQCVSTNGSWVEFNIPLKYKEGQIGEQPTHLIIVCSSSKYGDYFTGGTGSTLYLDDFSLDYTGTPTIWK